MTLAEYQKRFVTRYVLPSMGMMTALYYLAYFSLEPQKLLVLVVCALVVGLNVFVTTKNRVLRFGRFSVKTRSNDAFDAARWIVNILVADVALAWTFKPSSGGFVAAWLIIVLSAQADTFRRSHRIPIVALGLVVGGVLYARLYPGTRLAEYMLVMGCMTAIVLMAAVTESYWIHEIVAKQEARRREELAAVKARQLKHEALIGSHVRTISHELNNLMFVLEFATNVDEKQITGQELEMVRRSVAQARKLSALVLTDARSGGGQRRYAARDLVGDLELLLAKEVRERGIGWSLTIAPEAADEALVERGGGTYFIVHNLVKNAWEAIEARSGATGRTRLGEPPRGRIDVALGAADGRLTLEVKDDGGGMSDAQRAAILAGNGESTKNGGHGLGLRFVLDECRTNGFDLGIDVHEGVGTTFRLRIPTAPRGD